MFGGPLPVAATREYASHKSTGNPKKPTLGRGAISEFVNTPIS